MLREDISERFRRDGRGAPTPVNKRSAYPASKARGASCRGWPLNGVSEFVQADCCKIGHAAAARICFEGSRPCKDSSTNDPRPWCLDCRQQTSQARDLNRTELNRSMCRDWSRPSGDLGILKMVTMSVCALVRSNLLRHWASVVWLMDLSSFPCTWLTVVVPMTVATPRRWHSCPQLVGQALE